MCLVETPHILQYVLIFPHDISVIVCLLTLRRLFIPNFDVEFSHEHVQTYSHEIVHIAEGANKVRHANKEKALIIHGFSVWAVSPRLYDTEFTLQKAHFCEQSIGTGCVLIF